MLAWLSIILFGILQGLTEFLPVSSSGHLTLFQYFSKSINEDLSLNIAVHIGTLLTILVYYRRDIIQLIYGLIRWESQSVHMVAMILAATLPTGIIGLLMKKKMAWVLTHPPTAGACLLLTAFILYISDKANKVSDPSSSGFGIGLMQAVLIGLVQGMAVLPGISRSGSTIVAGLFLGMTPHNAARFSFLISVPAIAGAGLLEFLGADEAMDASRFLVGGAVSFVTGLLAIHWMVRLTIKRKVRVFAYYLVPVSILFLLLYSFDLGRDLF
jgi:undecaprenyl-diphosphatase